MKFQPRDVVITLPEFGERTFVIVTVKNNKYYCVALKNKKHYWIEENQIREKISVLPDTSPLFEIYDHKKGNAFAIQKAESSKSPDKERWEILACLNPGDTLEIYHKKFIRKAIFIQLNLKKPRLVFRARIEDKAFDLPLETVKVD